MVAKERFVVLARHYLDSFNPKNDKEVVILDAILAVPECFIKNNESLRYVAHDFVSACKLMTSIRDYTPHSTVYFDKPFILWLRGWWDNNGA